MNVNFEMIKKIVGLILCLAIAVIVVVVGNNYWPPKGNYFLVPAMCFATALFLFFTGVAIATRDPEAEFF